LSQRLIHDAPPVSLAALGNLDNTLREQVAGSGSPIINSKWAARRLQ
jgi:hypothetical protein